MRVKKRRAVAIATMASTLYAVACSVFVDTADLSGESAPDAATEGTPLAESGVDTGSVDTGSVDAGKRCDATFCDDFDEA